MTVFIAALVFVANTMLSRSAPTYAASLSRAASISSGNRLPSAMNSTGWRSSSR